MKTISFSDRELEHLAVGLTLYELELQKGYEQTANKFAKETIQKKMEEVAALSKSLQSK
jgi:hypothetical protein